MNLKMWLDGLWPTVAGAALLLPGIVDIDEGVESRPPARRAVEAPMPRAQQSVDKADCELTTDDGALFVSGGTGSDAFRAKTTVFESRLVLVQGAPSHLVVACALATLGPAPNDPGPASTFEHRLAAALGAESDASLHLEMECADQETLMDGFAIRVHWRGIATSGRMSQTLDFFLWQGARSREEIQALGMFDWPTGGAAVTQPSILGRHAIGSRITIGLDLRYRLPK